jgi:hypothetical protein
MPNNHNLDNVMGMGHGLLLERVVIDCQGTSPVLLKGPVGATVSYTATGKYVLTLGSNVPNATKDVVACSLGKSAYANSNVIADVSALATGTITFLTGTAGSAASLAAGYTIHAMLLINQVTSGG